MADNSAKIAELEAKLQRGMTGFTTDGQSGSYDLEQIRKELARLRAEDNTARRRKPTMTRWRTGGV